MLNVYQLKVRQLSIDLAVDIYDLTGSFPKEVTSQIRRDVVSISSNHEEGAGRNSRKEFFHLISVANGSGYELESQLVISKRLKYLIEERLNNILVKITHVSLLTSHASYPN